MPVSKEFFIFALMKAKEIEREKAFQSKHFKLQPMLGQAAFKDTSLQVQASRDRRGENATPASSCSAARSPAASERGR
jgi:hypothetical protein